MYYKDDFYKEFRTEKELCECLEEIDSRAEWIRVTSKKLKVQLQERKPVQRFRAFPWKHWKKIPYLIPGWFLSCPRGSVI